MIDPSEKVLRTSTVQIVASTQDLTHDMSAIITGRCPSGRGYMLGLRDSVGASFHQEIILWPLKTLSNGE